MHLSPLLHGLANRPEVTGAAVVSAEGLIIQQLLGSAPDREALAALATTLLRHSTELGTAAGLGGLTTAVLEFGPGPVVVSSLGNGASLVVLVRADADFGEILYLVRRHRDALAELL